MPYVTKGANSAYRKNRQVFSMRLIKSLHEKLAERAKQEDVSMALVVERALKKYLSKPSKKRKD